MLAAALRGRQRAVGSADDVAKWFRGLDRRRLVIIGEPGMGKTTLAVQILLNMLAGPASSIVSSSPARKRLPVPVLFSLSSFDPRTDSLDEWLTRRIAEAYPQWASDYGRETAFALVQGRKVMAILDGLDEVPQDDRPRAIDKLNSALADGKLEIILTCRTAEYGQVVAASDELRGAWVVQPDPVSGRAAADYLSRLTPRSRRDDWKPLLAALRSGHAGPVTEALSTPLMLWLASQVYRDRDSDPSELVNRTRFPESSEIQDYLLGEMVPVLFSVYTAYTRQPGKLRHRWQPEKAQRWLCYMAALMTYRLLRDLSWRELPTLLYPADPSRRLRAWYVAAPLLGVAATIGAGAIGWAAAWLAGGLGNAYLCGLAFGFTAWVANTLVTAFPYYFEKPRFRDSWGLGDHFYGTRGLFDRSRRAGMIVLIGLIAAWFAVQLANGLAVGLATRLVLGTAVALATARAINVTVGRMMRMWGNEMMQIWGDEWSRAVGTLRASRLQFTGACLGTALIGALGLGLAAGITNGLADGLTAGFFGALGAALASVVVLILTSPWGQYARAHIVYVMRGQLPWRLMSFLEDCHRIGVLRQLGQAYQFRHALLQDHLANVPLAGVWRRRVFSGGGQAVGRPDRSG